jgi:hypothetical protein
MGDPMGHFNGGERNHALVRRITSLGAATAAAATMLFIVATNAAASPVAQINLQAIVCPILLAIRGIFGGLIASIVDRLLQGFGCPTPSG